MPRMWTDMLRRSSPVRIVSSLFPDPIRHVLVGSTQGADRSYHLVIRLDPPRARTAYTTSVGADPVAEAQPDIVPDPGVASFASVRRRMLRGSAWTLGGKAATTVLGFVINILLARMLSLEELGGYFTAYTMVIVGSVIAQLGLDRAVVRFVSSSIGTGLAGRARDAVRTVFAFGSLGTAVMGVLVLAGGGWIARQVLHAPVLAAAIPLVAGWLAATAIQSLLVETFRSFQRFDLSTIFDALLVDVLCASVFGALYLVGAHPSLRQVLLTSAGFTAIVALVAGGLLARPLGRPHGGGRAPRGEIFAVAWAGL